jgi:hypothetical protein
VAPAHLVKVTQAVSVIPRLHFIVVAEVVGLVLLEVILQLHKVELEYAQPYLDQEFSTLVVVAVGMKAVL